jgi:hypothetical protein
LRAAGPGGSTKQLMLYLPPEDCQPWLTACDSLAAGDGVAAGGGGGGAGALPAASRAADAAEPDGITVERLLGLELATGGDGGGARGVRVERCRVDASVYAASRRRLLGTPLLAQDALHRAQPGDRLVAVNGAAVASRADANDALRAAVIAALTAPPPPPDEPRGSKRVVIELTLASGGDVGGGGGTAGASRSSRQIV